MREVFLELIVQLCSEGFILYVNSLYWNIGRALSRRRSGLGILGNGLSKGPQEWTLSEKCLIVQNIREYSTEGIAGEGRYWKKCQTKGEGLGFLRSCITQLCLTLCDPMDCSLPGSSVYGIL